MTVNIRALMEKAYSQNDIRERPIIRAPIRVVGEEGEVFTTPDYYFQDSKLMLYIGVEEASDTIRLLKEQGITILSFPKPRSTEDSLHVVEATMSALEGEAS